MKRAEPVIRVFGQQTPSDKCISVEVNIHLFSQPAPTDDRLVPSPCKRRDWVWVWSNKSTKFSHPPFALWYLLQLRKAPSQHVNTSHPLNSFASWYTTPDSPRGRCDTATAAVDQRGDSKTVHNSPRSPGSACSNRLSCGEYSEGQRQAVRSFKPTRPRDPAFVYGRARQGLAARVNFLKILQVDTHFHWGVFACWRCGKKYLDSYRKLRSRRTDK